MNRDTPADMLEVVTSLSASPLLQFLGLVGVLVLLGYGLMVLDTIRRTAGRRR